MDKNRFNCEIVVTDKETGEKILYKLDEFYVKLENDLQEVSKFAGDFLAPPVYSRGSHLTLTGYMKNPNMNNERKDAENEALQRVKK